MNFNFTFILEIIVFLLLVFSLQKFVFRPLWAMVEKRRRHIEEHLKEVKRLEDEAHTQRKQIETHLREAKKEALAIKEEAKTLSQEYHHKRKTEIEEEIAHLREKTQEELASRLNKVKEELRRYSVELSFIIAEKILGEEINVEKHRRLLKEGLKQLHEKDNFYS